VDAQDGEDRSALTLAVQGNWVEVVKLLLGSGASVVGSGRLSDEGEEEAEWGECRAADAIILARMIR
jgi:hypothetical protein